MSKKPEAMNDEARRAAFELAFANRRSPMDFEKWSDAELLVRILDRAPGASRAECLDALARARRLCDDTYEVCDMFRDGKYGEGAAGRVAAVRKLSEHDPGFESAEYEAAFATGLLWTAF